MRRDERGQERAMVEFIGFSNQREFKARVIFDPPRCASNGPTDGFG